MVELFSVQFNRPMNILVINFKNEFNIADNIIRNIENNIKYQWLVNLYEYITKWIVCLKRGRNSLIYSLLF